jgi:endonuclease/exonuclease/phosphatase family metal-dependent hydrolase
MELALGTFNILNSAVRYFEREPLLLSTLRRMDCDFVGLQELNFAVNIPPINALGWQVVCAPLPQPMVKPGVDESFRIDGNGFAYRGSTPLEGEVFVYGDSGRVAHKAYFHNKGVRFLMVNTHLDHRWDSIRAVQVTELLTWLEPHLTNGEVILLTGDFNANPSSETYKILSSKFKSTSLVLHGREPILTYPTGLQGPRCDQDRHNAYDYIWYAGNVTPLSSEVLCDFSAPDLYASDHYAIKAKFLIS